MNNKQPVRYRRLLLPAIVLVLLVQPTTRLITANVLAEAFLQVSAFVAATLALYYSLTHSIGEARIQRFLQSHPVVEVCVSALFGALPGCGGAIVVITQYTQGKISFGAVVAVLTATMGDAAFLLLAQQPLDGLAMIVVGMGVGCITGLMVNTIHPRDFMRPKTPSQTAIEPHWQQQPLTQLSLSFWQWVFWPALLVACLLALQIDANTLFNLPDNSIEYAGAAACFTAVALWALSSKGDSYQKVTSEEPRQAKYNWQVKVAKDTQFVTSWVVTAFLLFELSVLWFGLDLGSAFADLGPWVVALAVVVGFLPGCGPQIMVTTLYLQGAIPFSAQLGNAISNDGDALFPAIALAPKAAIIATLYSAIPAFAVGYGYYWIFEIT